MYIYIQASVQYACTTGYTIDPSIGASYVCNNGQWSTKPQCIKSSNYRRFSIFIISYFYFG